MLVILVFVQVKQEHLESFKTATRENAKNSVKETGIARFDVIQQNDDMTRFVLVEVYHSEAATFEHKKTVHYQKWRDFVEPMMAEPRHSMRYTNVFPDDLSWR
jgi:(4S)-4-hydroxy-5-phosphonooxypentane-2,3-dione isomerase